MFPPSPALCGLVSFLPGYCTCSIPRLVCLGMGTPKPECPCSQSPRAPGQGEQELGGSVPPCSPRVTQGPAQGSEHLPGWSPTASLRSLSLRTLRTVTAGCLCSDRLSCVSFTLCSGTLLTMQPLYFVSCRMFLSGVQSCSIVVTLALKMKSGV